MDESNWNMFWFNSIGQKWTPSNKISSSVKASFPLHNFRHTSAPLFYNPMLTGYHCAWKVFIAPLQDGTCGYSVSSKLFIINKYQYQSFFFFSQRKVCAFFFTVTHFSAFCFRITWKNLLKIEHPVNTASYYWVNQSLNCIKEQEPVLKCIAAMITSTKSIPHWALKVVATLKSLYAIYIWAEVTIL